MKRSNHGTSRKRKNRPSTPRLPASGGGLMDCKNSSISCAKCQYFQGYGHHEFPDPDESFSKLPGFEASNLDRSAPSLERLFAALEAFVNEQTRVAKTLISSRLALHELRALYISTRHADCPRKTLPDAWQRDLGTQITENTLHNYLQGAYAKLRINGGRVESVARFHTIFASCAARDLLIVAARFLRDQPGGL